MSLQSVAEAALEVFPPDPVSTPAGTLSLPVVMVAIAGAESTFGTYNWGPAGAVACQGHAYIGPWQISLQAHADWLRQQIGSQDPCAWAQWLLDPVHNAQAALAIYRAQGLRAWQTWTNGAWLKYLPQADQAIGAASLSTPPAPPASERQPAPGPIPYPYFPRGIRAPGIFLASSPLALGAVLMAAAGAVGAGIYLLASGGR